MDGEERVGTAGMRRFLTRAGLRAALPYLVIGALLVFAVLALGRELEQHLGAIESFIARLGPWGMLAFVALFVLASSTLVPDTVLCLLAGAVFGMAWGSVAAVVGSLLASALQFALARRLLRARIERALAARPPWAEIQRAVTRDELRLQVLLRLAPLNPATISYLLGAAGVRFAGFLVACLALVPGLIIEVYLGHAGKHLARAGAGGRTDRAHDLLLLGGVAVCIVAMTLVSRTARKALAQAAVEPAPRAAGAQRGTA